jgi:PAS domain S-box-containing protein
MAANMRKDRLGLMLIAASLLAIAVVGTLVYRNQLRVHSESIRVNGLAISRAIAGMESTSGDSPVIAGLDKAGMLHSLATIQNNDSLSYLVVVDGSGRKVRELVAPGSIVPAATMPLEAFAWFGEHTLVSPGDRKPIREFFAPVMNDGRLAGFVRAGYFDTYKFILGDQFSLMGLMALPIFLLTTLAYTLLRREIKPLSELGERLTFVSRSYGAEPAAPDDSGSEGGLLHRFDSFMQIVQARVDTLSFEKAESQTAARLTSYKHEKSEYALHCLPDAIVVLDDTGTTTFVNQKMEQLLSLSRDELIGKPVQDWCKNRDVMAFLMRHKQVSAAVRSATLDYIPDGYPERRIRIAAIPLFAPRDRSNLFGMLFVFRDISSEHLARQAGSDFVSHVAHELKTPLNALLGYSELLLHRSTLSEAEQVNAVNVIRSETERMAALINNLLNISKMEGGSLKPELARVRLHDLLQDAFNSLHNNALGRSIELELRIPSDLGTARLDKYLFRIAIDNLLSNAIKYSDPGGKIVVSVSMLDDGQMQIGVRDQGIGISADDCHKVFDKYYRSASDAAASRTGHGLGLYLAKQIVELHQGTISVSSELGKGTEFVVTLMAQPVQLQMSEAL